MWNSITEINCGTSLPLVWAIFASCMKSFCHTATKSNSQWFVSWLDWTQWHEQSLVRNCGHQSELEQDPCVEATSVGPIHSSHPLSWCWRRENRARCLLFRVFRRKRVYCLTDSEFTWKPRREGRFWQKRSDAAARLKSTVGSIVSVHMKTVASIRFETTENCCRCFNEQHLQKTQMFS